jgi:hypothetical protein
MAQSQWPPALVSARRLLEHLLTQGGVGFPTLPAILHSPSLATVFEDQLQLRALLAYFSLVVLHVRHR